MIHDQGRAVDAAGLESRARVAPRRAAVELERIIRARPRRLSGALPPPISGRPHRQPLAARHQLDLAGARRPHPELMHQPVLPSTATGNRGSSPDTLTSPPAAGSPVSTSAQDPPGSVTVVSPQSPRPAPSRGTTTASPPLRVKATARAAIGPVTGSGSYPEPGP